MVLFGGEEKEFQLSMSKWSACELATSKLIILLPGVWDVWFGYGFQKDEMSFFKRTVPIPLQLSDNFLEQRVYCFF